MQKRVINGVHHYYGTDAEMLAMTSMIVYEQFIVDTGTNAGNKYEYRGATAGWVQTHDASGAALVSGLARNSVVQGAGTYNATAILGYRVLVQGSGNWAETPVDGTAQTIPFAAQVVGNIHPEHLSAITVGTAGSALLYIPS